jgi:hypothetical protein
MADEIEETSEFGKGLTYCLALFLCHSERDYGKEFEKLNEKDEHLYNVLMIDTWFNGAGDHLFDLQIPKDLPKELKKRLEDFQHKILIWRLPMKKDEKPTLEDKKRAINEAKELIRLIDEFYGVKTMEASFK